LSVRRHPDGELDKGKTPIRPAVLVAGPGGDLTVQAAGAVRMVSVRLAGRGEQRRTTWLARGYFPLNAVMLVFCIVVWSTERHEQEAI
jgi:hypothetical protein